MYPKQPGAWFQPLGDGGAVSMAMGLNSGDQTACSCLALRVNTAQDLPLIYHFNHTQRERESGLATGPRTAEWVESYESDQINQAEKGRERAWVSLGWWKSTVWRRDFVGRRLWHRLKFHVKSRSVNENNGERLILEYLGASKHGTAHHKAPIMHGYISHR